MKKLFLLSFVFAASVASAFAQPGPGDRTGRHRIENDRHSRPLAGVEAHQLGSRQHMEHAERKVHRNRQAVPFERHHIKKTKHHHRKTFRSQHHPYKRAR